jgi:hypothetical protein
MMKKIMFALGIVLLFAFLAGGINAIQAKTKCCVAGDYWGRYEDRLTRTCPEPGEGEFKMVIQQDKSCGSNIWGEIIPSSGDPMDFEGTVTAGPDDCCTIKAVAKNMTDKVEFKAVLCFDGTKWISKRGKYVNANGCEGTFKMVQR